MIDNSEISLAQFVFDNSCNLQLQAGQSWGVPTLDCFAGHAKGQHQMSRSYNKFYGHGVVAVNAMYQDWTVDAMLPSRWVFPPFELVGEVIGKLQLEQTDAVLVVPKFRRHWQVLLKSLPIVAQHETSLSFSSQHTESGLLEHCCNLLVSINMDYCEIWLACACLYNTWLSPLCTWQLHQYHHS